MNAAIFCFFFYFST
ncbi:MULTISPECIES: pheST operon leader peptide PheM [Enterobacteriaceae]|nr:pheST operon leader peptide PheM [Salmonella enterica]EGH0991776.1 pheST operon leader peptide PheM [Salmonella enterica]MCM7086134.1 pheST operon leader peptide PheM [Enterobacter hormaechei]HBB9506891.1 pheST operon leader peptide PheM [Escherichia coli]